MIYQIAVPIYRTINAETAFIEAHKFGGSSNPEHPNNVIAEMAKETIAELDKYLIDGFSIIDTFESSAQTTTYRTYVLFKADSVAKPVNGTVVMAKYIARKQTYSKTTKQYFDFWKLTLTNGRDVNVFDHPDETRNTFKIAIAQGWENYFKQIESDESYLLPALIGLVVSNDGDWLKLEQIAAFHDYQSGEFLDKPDEPENIPFE